MTTWTSKTIAALGITAMLSACDALEAESSGILTSLTPPSDAALPPIPLQQAKMMRGRVTLVPPRGYCIDPESLSQSFALMGRCDLLGAPQGGSGAPVGVLTVSFARHDKDDALPSAQELAAASNLGAPREAQQNEKSVIFQTTGRAPASDLSPTHWRSVAQIGQYTMGAALFGPEGRRAISNEGATLLEEMITRTTDKTTAG